jgi:UDP-2,3-diacylglucosamine hydrolase
VAPVLFVSDVHLATERPATSELFLRFLREHASAASALYILGDLFEYWIGDDDRGDTLNESVLAALAAIAKQGVSIAFMPGNRDFMLGTAAATRAGMTLLADPTHLELAGRRTLLMHGDTLCTDDVRYQRYRALIRDPRMMALLGRLPLRWRVKLARYLREKSGRERPLKSAAIMDVNQAAVERAFRDSGASLLIHGHTHRPARHPQMLDGAARERIVLADWHERGGYLRCTGNALELLEFP